MPGRIRKSKELGPSLGDAYAQHAYPGWYRNLEYGGMDHVCWRPRGAWVGGAWFPWPQRTRGPYEACRGCAFGGDFWNPALSWGTGTRSRRPRDAHGRPGGGRTRAYGRRSSDGSSHPPTRPAAGPGGGCDSAGDSSQRRRIGRGGRGDGAAESHRQPMVATSPRRRRPGSAGLWVAQPRAARTRTTGKSSMVRRVSRNRPSGDHFPFSVWKRTLTATSARNRS
jgi:hypothetical protein